MRRTLSGIGIAIVAALVSAAPAFAQTDQGTLRPQVPRPTPSTTPAASGAPASNPWYLQGMAGGQVVQHFGIQLGGEVGFRVNDKVEVFGDVVWLQDVVTRRRIHLAQTVADYLHQTQGATASSKLTASAGYGGGGARVMLTKGEGGGPRVYVVGEVGLAHVTLKPAFTLAGANVTTQLTQYGVTLGSDLTGSVTKPAFGGGVGLIIPRGAWYLDTSLRVTSIKTPNQVTNVIRAGVGFGMRF